MGFDGAGAIEWIDRRTNRLRSGGRQFTQEGPIEADASEEICDWETLVGGMRATIW